MSGRATTTLVVMISPAFAITPSSKSHPKKQHQVALSKSSGGRAGDRHFELSRRSFARTQLVRVGGLPSCPIMKRVEDHRGPAAVCCGPPRPLRSAPKQDGGCYSVLIRGGSTLSS